MVPCIYWEKMKFDDAIRVNSHSTVHFRCYFFKMEILEFKVRCG